MPHLPWSAGTWTNAPADATERGGALIVTAVESSDAWRKTSYGFIHDTEHALLAPFEPNTAVEVEFDTPFTEQFDQAGIFIRASAEHWVKAGIEFADGVAQIGAVVTNDYSDWSATAAPEWAHTRVTVRASWDGSALTIRAKREGTDWQLVRVAPFAPTGPVEAGPLVCAPTRAGLEVPFYRWSVVPADDSLH